MLTRSSTSFGSAGATAPRRCVRRTWAPVADGRDVALADRAALRPDHAERVGRAAAEHDRHVDAARDGDVGAGAGAREVEQAPARLDGERRPAGLLSPSS
jgi:hypothetical protein